MRRIILWVGLALVLATIVLYSIQPWPSVWVIRLIFDRGAAQASAALQKHLPAGLAVREAVPYDPQDGDALLDVYRPTQRDPGAPSVVWVHGGGFVSGHRADIANYLKILAAQGFTVVNVDYTIAPEAVYPTPVRQLVRALAFIDRHAGALGVDRNALVLAGDSAGAQIAAQTANIIVDPAYARAAGIVSPIAPGQLKGALLYCGVYDVGKLGTAERGLTGWFLRTVTWAYSGHRDWRNAPGFERMSVARYAGAAFPPTFISAGNRDPLAPQSVLMSQRLKGNGVEVEALFFPEEHEPGLGHEYQFDLDQADGRTALAQSVAWLQRVANR